MITANQIDAALGLLGIKRSNLADALGIKVATFNTYFTGTEMKPGRNATIQKWFENAGLMFTKNGGIDINKDDVVLYEGKQGFIAFMRDVLEVSKKGNPDICVSNVDESNWQNNIGDFHQEYIDERAKLNIPPSKILVKTGDDYHTASEFAEYRESPEGVFTANVSSYAYEDKLALINFADKPVSVVVLNNTRFSKEFRSTFNYIWKDAKRAE
jgi:hypothetical protein